MHCEDTVYDCNDTSFPNKKKMTNVTYLACGYNICDIPLQIQSVREDCPSIKS